MQKKTGIPVRKKRMGLGSRLLFGIALTMVLVICATAAIYVGFYPPEQQAELAGMEVDLNQQIEMEENTQQQEEEPREGMVSVFHETEKVTPDTEKKKICYLTFDDGPSQNTVKILDTLKKYDIKATFFLVGTEIDGYESVIQRMAEEGHTIGIHCNRHDYGALYSSVDGFLSDFERIYQKIYDITGEYPQCFRFPGGSNNVIAERHGTTQAIIDEMTERGFDYYDWNAYTGDAESGSSAERVYSKAISEITGSSRREVILLAHDAASKTDTAEQLPRILDKLCGQVEFLPITASTEPIQFIAPTEPEEADADQPAETEQNTD